MFSGLTLVEFLTQDTPVTAVTLLVFLDGAIKAFIPLLITVRVMERKNEKLRETMSKLM